MEDFTKDQEEDKDSNSHYEGWNSQNQFSGQVEEKGRRRKLLYPHPKLSLYFPIAFNLK